MAELPPIAPMHDGGPAAAPDKTPVPSTSKVGLTWIFSKPAGIEFTKSEITVAQYRACKEAGKCTPAHFDDGTCRVYDGLYWAKGSCQHRFEEMISPWCA